jgi:hypothetical protein
MANDEEHQAALVEFVSLRSEILKRMEFMSQIINWTLLAAAGAGGGIITLGSDSFSPVWQIVLLAYPVFGFLLAAEWSFNNLRINQLAAYIYKRIEEPYFAHGWEHALHDRPGTGAPKFGGFSLGVVAAVGIFIGTQSAALALGLTWPTPQTAGNEATVFLDGLASMLKVVDPPIIVLTYLVIFFSGRPHLVPNALSH